MRGELDRTFEGAGRALERIPLLPYFVVLRVDERGAARLPVPRTEPPTGERVVLGVVERLPYDRVALLRELLLRELLLRELPLRGFVTRELLPRLPG